MGGREGNALSACTCVRQTGRVCVCVGGGGRGGQGERHQADGRRHRSQKQPGLMSQRVMCTS
jgi:hypothetical protein